MAGNEDEAAVERAARRIFELQNPGKPWPGDAQAKRSEQDRDREIARKDRGSREG